MTRNSLNRADPRHARISALNALAALALALFAGLSWADAAGTVTHLSGTLVAKRADGSSKLLSVRSEVLEGDQLSTQDGTYARIKFVDGAEAVLRPNSQLTVNQYRYKTDQPGNDSAVLSLVKGGLRSVTGAIGKRNPDSVNMNTPVATIGIRGTHYGALMCQGDCGNIPSVSGRPPSDGLHVDVADGAIRVTNQAGQQTLNAGQFGFAGSPTTPPVIVPPNQGIQVTMPPAISQNNAGGRSLGVQRGTAECAVQ